MGSEMCIRDRFELDDSLKYGAHMFDLLSKLEAEQKEKAGETGNDEA